VQIETLQPRDDPRSASLYAVHHDESGFFNPWRRFPHSIWALLKFWVRPKLGAPRRRVTPRPSLPNTGNGEGAITWVGHCTFAIQDGTDVVLTDPHWGARCKTRTRRASPGLPLEAIPDHACAVLSHSHYDHLDRRTVRRLSPETRWFVPLGLAGWLRRRGQRHVVELDWWQRVQCGKWTFTCLPAQHWSIRLGHRRNATLWASWLIESPTQRVYFAGDTGYFHGFREFGRRFGPIDVALLPIGTYEPRWHLAYQHMEPRESWQAFVELRAGTLIPMHWGTFQMAWDPTHEAPKALFRAIEERGGDPQRVRVLDIGETHGVRS
jgi:N-acyl-phosphatidylethanolamine-hydrolysing phospholipase D